MIHVQHLIVHFSLFCCKGEFQNISHCVDLTCELYKVPLLTQTIFQDGCRSETIDKGSKLLSEDCEHITFLVLMALSEE